MTPETLPSVVEPTPLLLIQQGIDAKISPRDMKDLFDLQVRYEQRLAELAYADAITAFQSECPPIHKGKAGPNAAYMYAPYETIMKVITPLLRRHKIVVTFDTAEGDGKMQVTCRVRVGVVEKHTTVMLAVGAGNKMMSPTQAGVGAISYGKRTALCAALNIVCTDEDTDGQADPDEKIIASAQEEIDSLLRQAGMDDAGVTRFLAWVGKVQGAEVKTLADITVGALPKVMDMVRRKVAAKKGGAA